MPQHRALIRIIKAKRKAASLSQAEVARRMHEYQSWMARLELGQRRIDVVEFIALGKAIGFDPVEVLKQII